MAFEASSTHPTEYQDALADLRTLALANGWQEGVGVTGGRYTDSTEDEWIATGTGGGGDAITCGIRTYSDEQHQYYNWELAGMDQYTHANTWENQPGISPGRYDGAGDAAYGSYVPLANRTMKYWYSATAYRLTGVIRVGAIYTWFYIGWGNRHDSVGNYAQPKCIAGTMNIPTLAANAGHVAICSGINPVGHATAARHGPMQIHNRAGTWEDVINSTWNNNIQRTVYTSGIFCWPGGRPNIAGLATGADSWVVTTVEGAANAFVMGQAIPPSSGTTNYPGPVNAIIKRSPNSGGEDTVKRFNVIISEATQSHMTLDGVFWASAAGSENDPEVQPEDRLEDVNNPGTFYRAFPVGATQPHWGYLVMEEK
jgi:hypothetical protein